MLWPKEKEYNFYGRLIAIYLAFAKVSSTFLVFFFLFLKAEDTIEIFFHWKLLQSVFNEIRILVILPRVFVAAMTREANVMASNKKDCQLLQQSQESFIDCWCPVPPPTFFFLIRHMKHFSSKSVELTILKSSFNS